MSHDEKVVDKMHCKIVITDKGFIQFDCCREKVNLVSPWNICWYTCHKTLAFPSSVSTNEFRINSKNQNRFVTVSLSETDRLCITVQFTRSIMDKASKALRRSGVRIRSIGSGHSDLQMVIAQLKDVRTTGKVRRRRAVLICEQLLSNSNYYRLSPLPNLLPCKT